MIYIEKYGDSFPFDGAYSVFEYVYHNKLPYILFEDINEVPRNSNNIIVACVETTKVHFERLGLKVPESMDFFSILFSKGYISRTFQRMNFHQFLKSGIGNVFVKPSKDTKAFVSGVIKSSSESTKRNVFSDYLNKYPYENPEVIVFTLIDIISEYRVFYQKGKGIVGMKHYLGDFMVYPNNKYINDVINEVISQPLCPSAFTADFAVLKNGSTELIEFNDAWSCGSYGLDGEIYFKWLNARWQELTKK